jgi:hypothetical protein
VAAQAYSQTGGEVLLTTDLTIDRSSWLSARTEKSHAGAVFAIVNGNPVRPTTDSPQYFVDYMDWLTGLVQDDVFDQLTPEDKAALLVDIAAAKSVFQQILSEAQQVVAVDDEPLVTSLVGALPNPFQGSTAISFRGREASDAKVRIYSSDGRLVRELSSASPLESGGTFVWDGRDADGRNVASGVYVYRVTVRGSLLGHGKVVRVE